MIGKGFGVREQTPSPSPSHNLLYYVHHRKFPLVHEHLTPAGDLSSVDRKHRFSGGGGAHVLEGAEIGWLGLGRRTENDVNGDEQDYLNQ